MRGMLTSIAIVNCLFAVQGHAKTVSVEMQNKDPVTMVRNIYAPGLVHINPGDTVRRIASNKGHNIEFIRRAVPSGVARFKSKLGKHISYRFEIPGCMSTNAHRTSAWA